MMTITEIKNKAIEYMHQLVNDLTSLNTNQKKNVKFICEILIHSKINKPIYEKRNPKVLAAAIVYIAALRNRLAVTQREIACIIKVTQHTIYKYYRLILNNDIETIKRASVIPL